MDKSPWDSTEIFIFFCHFSGPSQILFEIFLQFSLPLPTQSWNSEKKSLDTCVQHCLWGDGRDWTCVNWRTPQKCKSAPKLAEMPTSRDLKSGDSLFFTRLPDNPGGLACMNLSMIHGCSLPCWLWTGLLAVTSGKGDSFGQISPLRELCCLSFLFLIFTSIVSCFDFTKVLKEKGLSLRSPSAILDPLLLPLGVLFVGSKTILIG